MELILELRILLADVVLFVSRFSSLSGYLNP
jgi:hypothetical protein